MSMLNLIKRHITILLIAFFVCLYGCSASQEKKDANFDVVKEVVDPIILLLASTCVHHHEKASWPSFEGEVGDESLFEYFLFEDMDVDSAVLNFKLRAFSFDWELRITDDQESAEINCNGELRGGSPGKEKLFKLPIKIDTTNVEKLVGEENRESRAFMGHYVRLVGFFDDLTKKPETERINKFEDVVISLGGYITYGSLCVLLAISGASCI